MQDKFINTPLCKLDNNMNIDTSQPYDAINEIVMPVQLKWLKFEWNKGLYIVITITS